MILGRLGDVRLLQQFEFPALFSAATSQGKCEKLYFFAKILHLESYMPPIRSYIIFPLSQKCLRLTVQSQPGVSWLFFTKKIFQIDEPLLENASFDTLGARVG